MFLSRFKCIFAVLVLATTISFAKEQTTYIPQPGQIQNDSQLVEAIRSQKDQFYIEAGNLVVTNILPEDTKGLPHQLWETQASDGSVVTVVYNSDMGDRVPVKVGDIFSVGGQFIWTHNGGLVHWVHADPKKMRPDGYVYVNGSVFGDIDQEESKK